MDIIISQKPVRETTRLKLIELDGTDTELVEKARLLEKRHSDISGVSPGLRTSRGTEFSGGVDARTATVGMCAEYSAIGTMVTNGERSIRTLVAIAYRGDGRYEIIPLCGKCRNRLLGRFQISHSADARPPSASQVHPELRKISREVEACLACQGLLEMRIRIRGFLNAQTHRADGDLSLPERCNLWRCGR